MEIRGKSCVKKSGVLLARQLLRKNPLKDITLGLNDFANERTDGAWKASMSK